MTALRLAGLTKQYGASGAPVEALRGVTLEVPSGQSVAILGPSGCGKSTLLGLIAGIEAPTSGSVIVGERDLGRLGDAARARYRREAIGIVFQSTDLLPFLTAVENVDLALALTGHADAAVARALLGSLDLASHADKLPDQLSGGQRQRVGIARAIAHRPGLILADEPTGELDSASSALTMELLRRAQRDIGATLIVVTHDENVARSLDRIVRLRDGSIVSDSAIPRAVAGV